VAKDTPSMAKNKIKRSLSAIIDPHPSEREITALWNYFDSSCVYCGLKMERKSRTAHLDHVVACSEGGNNSIYNHVLSCGKCNGDEKRDMNWLIFLKQKSLSPDFFESQKLKVENWIKQNNAVKIETVVMKEAEKIIKNALSQFDESVKDMRNLRKINTKKG